MPWPEALLYTHAIRALLRERLLAQSVAARAAGAEQKGWDEWVRRFVDG